MRLSILINKQQIKKDCLNHDNIQTIAKQKKQPQQFFIAKINNHHMYLGLQLKPFYFITDRQTNYQFLVDNKDKKAPKKYIYYPEEYEKMSPKTIQKNKKNIVYKFLWWALSNQQKMEYNDYKIAQSTLMNSFIIMVVCAFAAKALRKLMFRTELPVLQIKLEKMGFNIRLFKAFTSYSIFTWLGYKFISRDLKETHLIDLATEYKYFFANQMHSPTDTLYEQLWKERIASKQSKAEGLVL